jgi:hypothetical protein
MAIATDLPRRIDCARDYYRAVDRFLSSPIAFAASLTSRATLSVPESYGLLHPKLYEEVVDLESVLGQRRFSLGLAVVEHTCMCDRLWGYRCEFVGRPSHLDHMFPYALGGATDVDNLLVLCDVHNLAKGHDIHVYPWPSETPSWVHRAIERLGSHCLRGR